MKNGLKQVRQASLDVSRQAKRWGETQQVKTRKEPFSTKLERHLKKPEIHPDLGQLFDYYENRDNLSEWSTPAVEKYGFGFIYSIFNFLDSLDKYFKATLSLATYVTLKPPAKPVDIEIAYNTWRMCLEDSVLKVKQVLKHLEK